MSASSSETSMPMLNCGMCKSLYRQPRILDCLHSFCQTCLLQLPILCSPEGQPVLSCPQCSHEMLLPSEGISGLVHNDFLARMCQDYVTEVQKTLGTSRPFSRGASSAGQGPTSPTSFTSGRSFASSTQFGAASRGGVSSRSNMLQGGGLQSPRSPSQGTEFSYDVQRGSTSYSYGSSSSSDTGHQTARRPSVEMIPLRAMQRKLSSTPPDVLRIWEALQRKLNSLQSASMQITYSLETVNMTESNWYQRKQDLRRDVQRRSAQLQFFIKRQERLLLAMLDSRDTDDSFTKAAAQARDHLRSNLRSVVHETEVLKSVLDLGTDTELLNLSTLLLGSIVSQQPVTMEIPELQFKIPDELSPEDKMGKDFGCFTSTTVTHDVYKPEVFEQHTPEKEAAEEDKPEDDEDEDTCATAEQENPEDEDKETCVAAEQEMPEDEEDRETCVTETFIVDNPVVSGETSTPIPVTTDHVSEEEPQPEDGEEEESEEEEFIVEDTIEIIDGKMQVISSRRIPVPKTKPETQSPSADTADKSTKKTEEKKSAAETRKEAEDVKFTKPEEPTVPSTRGRDPHTRRTANSSAALLSRSERTADSASSRSMTGRLSSQQTRPAPDAYVTSSSLTESKETNSKSTEMHASRPTSLFSDASKRRSPQEAPDLRTAQARDSIEDKESAEESGSKESDEKTPSEESEHQSTLNKFQNFRELLRQRRRDLLGKSFLAGPGELELSQFLHRERRVQSLDRRPSLQDHIRRPLSPEGQIARGITASLRQAHSFDIDDFTPDDSVSVTTEQATDQPTSETSATSPLSPTERTSRPVRRAVSAASDKATKMEFLRETWKKRKELLIQNDAYITTTPTEPEEGEQGGAGSSLDDAHRSGVKPKARSRITDMTQAVMGDSVKGGIEPSATILGAETVAQGAARVMTTTTTQASNPPTTVTESPVETQVMKTVDKILQKKNVPIPEPQSPTSLSQTSFHDTSPPWASKPSMVVRPRPRDPPTAINTSTTTTTTTSAATFIPTPLETLQEDETKTSPEKQSGLRASSPTRTDKLRASIRRKKERWRSLSLT